MATNSQHLEALRSALIAPVSTVVFVGTAILALISFIDPDSSGAIIALAVSVLSVANLLYFLRQGHSVVSARILSGLLAVLLLGTVYSTEGSFLSSGWLAIYPLLIFLINGRNKAHLISLTYILALLPAIYLAWEGEIFFGYREMISGVLAVAVVTALSSRFTHDLVEGAYLGSLDFSSVAERKTRIDKRNPSDITKELEEKNLQFERVTAIDEAIISSIGEAVLIVDEKGTVVRANPSTGRVLGVNQKDMIGKQIVDRLQFTLLEDESKPLEEEELVIFTTITHRSINDETYKITQPDGHAVYAVMTSSPLVVSGQVYGAVVVVRDVTQEVGIDKAKTEFVSIASHQLRTPLSTINWYLEIVLSGDLGKLEEQQKDSITEAYQASKRMGDLINALLNASRLDVGVVGVDPEELDIREIIKQTLTDLEAKILETNTDVAVRVDDEVKPMNLDRRIMGIILLNLLSNAIKYTPQDGKVSVTAKMVDGAMQVEVSDNGYGIPEKAQSKMFTKMYRAENVVEHVPDGNGLGLYIIKSILDTIGGSISFVSKENEGTTFTVVLPESGMEPRAGTKQLS